MCIDTKHRVMLIVLHICSFLMSYDNLHGMIVSRLHSVYTSLDDSETIVSHNHTKQSVPRDVCYLSGEIWFLTALFIW